MLAALLITAPATDAAAGPPAAEDMDICVPVVGDDLSSRLTRCLDGMCCDTFPMGNSFRISGWTEASFTASSASDQHLPLGFNYRANEFLIQQNWLRLDHPADTEADAPTFGFRSDTILPGSDYRFTTARGLFDGQLTADRGSPARYGIDPVQFYGQAFFPDVAGGMDVRLGRFFSPYGAESIDTTQTPLTSRAYTFIYNPFTHTGLLTALKLSESVTIHNGLATGSDIFIDSAANPTGILGARWADPDRPDSLQLVAIFGSGRFDEVHEFNNPQVLDLLYSRQLTDEFSYTLDALAGCQTKVPGIGMTTWSGLVQYLSYRFSSGPTATARLEFFDDVDGNRTGFEGLYSALTVGLKVPIREHILFRPELRYDHNSESRPFDNRSELLAATADFVVLW